MILKPEQISIGNNVWYYQEFTPDNEHEEYAVNLYDPNGDFVRDFSDLDEMIKWVEMVDSLRPLLTTKEKNLLRMMCQLGIFNFYHAAREPFCPIESEKNILQDLFMKLTYAREEDKNGK